MHRMVTNVATILAFVVACDPEDGPGGGPQVVTDTLGDTVVVRTLSGSVWGDDAGLVPELSIGEALDGPEEHLFGSIASLAVGRRRQHLRARPAGAGTPGVRREGGVPRDAGAEGPGAGRTRGCREDRALARRKSRRPGSQEQTRSGRPTRYGRKGGMAVRSRGPPDALSALDRCVRAHLPGRPRPCHRTLGGRSRHRPGSGRDGAGYRTDPGRRVRPTPPGGLTRRGPHPELDHQARSLQPPPCHGPYTGAGGS